MAEGGGEGRLLDVEDRQGSAGEEAEQIEHAKSGAWPWRRLAALSLLGAAALLAVGLLGLSDLSVVRGKRNAVQLSASDGSVAVSKAFQQRSLEDEEGSEESELTGEDIEKVMTDSMKRRFDDLATKEEAAIKDSFKKFGKQADGADLFGRIMDYPSGPSPAVPFYFCGAACQPGWVCCNYGRLCAPPGSKCCGSSFVKRGHNCCNHRQGLICTEGSKCCGQRLCCAAGYECGFAEEETEVSPHIVKQPQCGTGGNLP